MASTDYKLAYFPQQRGIPEKSGPRVTLSSIPAGYCEWSLDCSSVRHLPEPMSMTLRIERLEGRVRLSGEFRIACVDQVKAEIEKGESPRALDLEEVALIDLEGVRFLNACEENGIEVLHCSPYIREWMLQERIRGRKS